MTDLLNQIVQIAQQAGDKILSVYNADMEIEYKDNDSPLTKADRLAHDYIFNALNELSEKFPILSEEGAEIPFAERSGWVRYWLVDPLDGTKEFIKRNGEFTVNIALIENHKPVLGVVYAPVLERTYYAAQGVGAFRQENQKPPVKIAVEHFKSQSKWKVVASRSHMSPETVSMVNALGDTELVSMGSSLKLCLVAEGTAHIYPRLALTSEWDTAASQCVVEQAGGVVVTQDLKPLEYNRKDSLLNPYFIVSYGLDEAWTNSI